MSKSLYLSYTAFTKYVDCPHSYYLEYVLKQRPKIQDQRNVLNGNVLHNLLEAYIENGVNDTSWLLKNLKDYWTDFAQNNHIVFKDKDDPTVLFSKAVEWTTNLARMLDEMRLDVNNCLSELKADTMTKVGKYNVIMGARLDLVLRNDNFEYIFFDLKASENKSIMKFDQLVWYAHVLGLYIGDQEKVVGCGYILPGLNSTPTYRVPQQAKDKLMARLEKVVDNIYNEIWETKPESKRCFWCPVKHLCPEQGGIIPMENGIITL